jgi:D-isomer specific 2-hydroxyacid dehydrogenase, NAD binding domain
MHPERLERRPPAVASTWKGAQAAVRKDRNPGRRSRRSEPLTSAMDEAGRVRVDLFSAKPYDRRFFDQANAGGRHVLEYPYSPYAVAEHTLALILSLDQQIHRAYQRVRDRDFALDGLLGFDINGRTAGVGGTVRIGVIVARLLRPSAAPCWPTIRSATRAATSWRRATADAPPPVPP